MWAFSAINPSKIDIPVKVYLYSVHMNTHKSTIQYKYEIPNTMIEDVIDITSTSIKHAKTYLANFLTGYQNVSYHSLSIK